MLFDPKQPDLSATTDNASIVNRQSQNDDDLVVSNDAETTGAQR
jgi:hypothetical protein